MSDFAFCVLGSGSSGNCSLLKLNANRWIMIDAGFSMRQTKERMRMHNVYMKNISGVLLTHLDRDHFNPAWCRTLLHMRIAVHLHERHLHRAIRAGLDRSILRPFKSSIKFDTVQIETLHMAHDELGTVGFVFTYLD